MPTMNNGFNAGCTLSSLKQLKSIITAIYQVVQEANIEFTDEGFKIMSLDAAHVCIIEFNMHASSFEHFYCKKNVVVGMKLEQLTKVLKIGNPNKSVSILIDVDDNFHIQMFIANTPQMSGFEIATIEIHEDRLTEIDMPEEIKVNVDGEWLSDVITGINSVSDNVNIYSESEKKIIYFKYENVEGKATIPCAIENKEDGCIIEEDLRYSFSTKYLLNFMKGVQLSNTFQQKIILQLAIERPLLLICKIDDVSYIKYYLAAKIENE